MSLNVTLMPLKPKVERIKGTERKLNSPQPKLEPEPEIQCSRVREILESLTCGTCLLETVRNVNRASLSVSDRE